MDLTQISLVAAAEMIRSGRMSCLEYVETLILRAEEHADLNAFTRFDAEEVRRAAREADGLQRAGGDLGALHGIPVAIKDCIDIAGMATTAATPALKDHVVGRTASVVRSLQSAGAIVFGKTNMYELAFGITGNNDHTGPALNPHDRSRSAGGSSSGSAVAVAAGIVPASVGTDTAGSVRIPASCCGVFGFRPSTGRYGSDGVMPVFPTRDVPGLFARSAEDLLLLDAVLADEEEVPDIPLEDVRLGLPGGYFLSDLESGVAAAFEETLAQLVSGGVEIVDAAMPDVPHWLKEMAGPIRAWELPRSLEAYLKASGAPVDFRSLISGVAGSYVREEFEEAMLGADDEDLGERYRHVISVALPEYRKRYVEHLRHNGLDAIVFPTTPIAATPLGQEKDVIIDGQQVSVWKTLRNTEPATFFGAPGVTMPMSRKVHGVPVGFELDGLPGEDRRLLAVAARISEGLRGRGTG